MKHWNKVLALLLVLLLSLSLLSGCSPRQEEEQSQPENSEQVQQETQDKENEQEEKQEEQQEEQKENNDPLPEADDPSTYPVIEAVDLSNMALSYTENSEIRYGFPADSWTAADPSYAPLTIFWNDTIEGDQSVNINVQKSMAFGGSLNQAFLEDFLSVKEEMEQTAFMEITLAELRTVNGVPVFYMENVTEITDEALDMMIEAGVLTEEMIKDAGGREVFLAIPPTESVAIYVPIDGYMVIYTGTYYEESQKSVVLDAITVLMQCTEYVTAE